jgi:outer membrane lipoprotein LolB
MLKRLLFLFIPILLAGCSSKIPQHFSPDYIPQQWQFTGKFAIKTPEQAQGLKIHWQQINDQFDINLYTVFGITVLKIKGNDEIVKIETDETPIEGQSAEQLIWQQTGWHIPVANLQHWLVGEVDTASNVELTNEGYFNQGDITDSYGRPWRLTLTNYKLVQGRPMPHSLRLNHDKLLLKLAISNWQIDR